jgi:hypothetical protein
MWNTSNEEVLAGLHEKKKIVLEHFFHCKGIVHLEFIPEVVTVNRKGTRKCYLSAGGNSAAAS